MLSIKIVTFLLHWQGFRELALLQQQQMAQRVAAEAQKRIQEQQQVGY